MPNPPSHGHAHSPHSLYHPIPQGPEAVPLEPDDIDEEEEDTEITQPKVTRLSDAQLDFKVKWIYFILGCAILLPWNVVITAIPYFLERLAGSRFEHTFGSYLSSTFTIVNFVVLAHATISSKYNSPSRRTRLTLFWLILLNFLLVSSTFFTLSPGPFFAFVLFNAAAQAVAGSYLQTAVIATASLIGPMAVQSMYAGQAAVAVAISGVQVVTAITSTLGGSGVGASKSDGSPEERSAFLFFTFSTLFLAASAGAHELLLTMSAYKSVATPLEQHAIKAQHAALVSSGPEPLILRGRTEMNDAKKQAIRVAKANLQYEFAVGYVYFITLAVFPAITATILPVNPETRPLVFSSFHFLVFNLGDFVSRYICSLPSLCVWSSKRLLGMSLVRTLFIPLFLMCNVQRTSSPIPSTPIINSDFMYMLLLFLLGMTNGYVSTLCMMSAPSIEHNPRLKGRIEDVDVAATVATFCLVGGLALGAIASFAVKGAICQCNPFTQ